MNRNQFSDANGKFYRMQLNNGNWIKTGEAYGYVFDWDRQFQYATCDGQPTDFVPDGTRVNENDILCSISDAVTALRAAKTRKPVKSSAKPQALVGSTYRDLVDFRDKLYVPTLVEVPKEYSLDRHLAKTKGKIPILNQQFEGSCTGHALAAVAHYLLQTRQIVPDAVEVSPHMLYTLAKKYDEWPGSHYSGSSARGAIKAWHKHGVCSKSTWPSTKKDERLDRAIAHDALTRPLGAYFRVNHKDLVAMHSAITEAGILFVTLDTHEGWDNVKSDGIVQFDADKFISGGGHAVALVGYDQKGFWFQNSWTKNWGKKGYGHICYDDWLSNGWDVWVARLGAPVEQSESSMISREYSSAHSAKSGISIQVLKPHVISIENNGILSTRGSYSTTADDLDVMFGETFDSITKSWKKKRILFYAHGGLVNEESAIQRLADYRQTLLENEIYPVSFIWHTGFWETIKNILADTLQGRKAEGFLHDTWDAFLDKTDTMLEAISSAPGNKLWSEMKSNAIQASTRQPQGAIAQIIPHLQKLYARHSGDVEFHFIGHSAGSIFHAPFLQWWAGAGTIPDGPMKGLNGLAMPVQTVSLWAPAITTALFEKTYAPLIASKKISEFNLFVLDDKTEQDDNCGGIYRKSLLYLVSNSFEEAKAKPDGRGSEPIFGMEKWLNKTGWMKRLNEMNNCRVFLSPDVQNQPPACSTKEHGGFDDDKNCLQKTLSLILKAAPKGDIKIGRSSASKSEKRKLFSEKMNTRN